SPGAGVTAVNIKPRDARYTLAGGDEHASPGDGSSERNRAGDVSATRPRCGDPRGEGTGGGGRRRGRGGGGGAGGGGGRAAAGLDALDGELHGLGADTMLLRADMGTADGPARAVGEAVARFGGLEGLVSNAGVNRPGPLVDYAVEDWDHLFAVNTRATWLLA